jgi:hypothetical protein
VVRLNEQAVQKAAQGKHFELQEDEGFTARILCFSTKIEA